MPAIERPAEPEQKPPPQPKIEPRPIHTPIIPRNRSRLRKIFPEVLAILLLLLLAISYIGITAPKKSPSLTSVTSSLRTLAQTENFHIGAAVNVHALRTDAKYRDTLAHEFNIVTPENAMKFAAIQPGRHVYAFQDADTIVTFARAHGMQVRGHNLVWYKVLPSWLTGANFSRQEAMAILHDHISTVVSHYRRQVSDWDVVNEALNYDGTLLNSFWLQTIGPDYIDLAFRWAHEADPQARLFYNDYGGEGLGLKPDAIYNLVKNLRQRGVPINGVGLQMHVSLDATPNRQDVLANMKRLATLGVEVQITEMDVETQDDPRSPQDKLTAQANIYRNMLNACLAVPNCTAFVMWGFTDRYSWIPYFTGHPDVPLIFDTSYRPKPAYNALLGVLAESTRRKRP